MRDEKSFNVILGQKVKKLRKLKGWKQLDLAYELKYESSGIVSVIEQGKCGMKREKIYEAAEIFGIPPFVLFDDRDYSDEDLSMMVDFYDFIDKKDSPYREAIRTLLKQANK